ncbi:MAG: SRPBCC family protein [Haloarculaceae archaeon]
MIAIDVGTLVHLPPEPVYEFLVDFPQYGDYSEYLEEVDRQGDGLAGTNYDITVSWWRLRQTVRSEVTWMNQPEQIGWEVTDPVDAHGAWRLDPAPDRAPPAAETATAVTLEVRYDPESVGEVALDLPPFVSVESVLNRVRPILEREAEAVVERVVEDLEGSPRPVDLEIRRPTSPDSEHA